MHFSSTVKHKLPA